MYTWFGDDKVTVCCKNGNKGGLTLVYYDVQGRLHASYQYSN